MCRCCGGECDVCRATARMGRWVLAVTVIVTVWFALVGVHDLQGWW